MAIFKEIPGIEDKVWLDGAIRFAVKHEDADLSLGLIHQIFSIYLDNWDELELLIMHKQMGI